MNLLQIVEKLELIEANAAKVKDEDKAFVGAIINNIAGGHTWVFTHAAGERLEAIWKYCKEPS